MGNTCEFVMPASHWRKTLRRTLRQSRPLWHGRVFTGWGKHSVVCQSPSLYLEILLSSPRLHQALPDLTNHSPGCHQVVVQAWYRCGGTLSPHKTGSMSPLHQFCSCSKCAWWSPLSCRPYLVTQRPQIDPPHPSRSHCVHVMIGYLLTILSSVLMGSLL